METKIINLYAGPSAGKSTKSAELFVEMKKRNFKVEYITEIAKSLVYGKDATKLSDQLLVFALQNHEIYKLVGQVDYVISDSPLLLSLVYHKPDSLYDFLQFKEIVQHTNGKYTNIDIFLERGDYPFESYGRLHNEDESKRLDHEILSMLDVLELPYTKIKNNEDCIKEIINIL
jgi:hypothetical protein